MKKKTEFKLANIQLKIKSIVNREPANNPIENNEKNTQIDKINDLEFEYLNLKAKEIQKEFVNNLDHYDFYRIEGHLGKMPKSEYDVFKEYIRYLEKKIIEEKIIVTALEDDLESEHRIQSATYDVSESDLLEEIILKTRNSKLKIVLKGSLIQIN